MARMSLDTAIRLSAEVKGGANITKVQRSLQDLAKGSQTTARDMDALRTATAQYARASEGSIAGIRNSIGAFRGLQEQAKIGSREFKQYGSEVQRLEGKLRGLEGAARRANPALDGLGAAAGRLIAAYAGIETVRFVFGKTAEIEAQTRSLEVLTGSADRAKQIVSELQQLGAVTPFTSAELIDTAKRLQAFGVEADNVVDITRRLADVSGATGAELAGLATAYGQVQAKGRLQGEELLQFQERGVALQQVLREEYGLSGAEFQKALEGGKISAEAVEFALKKLTDSGGKYANGAIAQSDTLNGRLSTLSDSVQVLAQTIGKSLAPVFKWALTQATGVVSEIQRMIDEANNAGGARGREAQFARNADAAVRSMGLNPFTQQGMMADMRQRNIEQQRADYKLSQQRARVTNAAPPSNAPPPLSGAGAAASVSGGRTDTKARQTRSYRGGASTGWTRDRDAEQSGYDLVLPGGRGASIPSPVDNLKITGTGFQGSGAGASGRGYGAYVTGTFKGSDGKTYELLLGHLDGVNVNVGDMLRKGETIGKQGITGRTFGTHITTHVNSKSPGGDAWGTLKRDVAMPWVKGWKGGEGEDSGWISDRIDAEQKAAEEAKAREDGLRSSSRSAAIAKMNLDISRATTEEAKLQANSDRERAERMYKFSAQLAEAKSTEQQINLMKQQGLEATQAQVDLDQKLVELAKDRVVELAKQQEAAMRPMLDSIEQKQAQLGGPAAVRAVERRNAIGSMAAAGVDPARAGELFDENQALDQRIRKQQELNDLVNEGGQAMQGFLDSMIRGTESWQEALAGLVESLGRALLQAGLSGLAGKDGVGLFSILAGTFGKSFAGGGYTGSSPRAGGIDGQGGFPAILHPQETVIDHTRMMPLPYQKGAGAAATSEQIVPYRASAAAATTGQPAVPYQASAAAAGNGLMVPFQSGGTALAVPFLKGGGTGDGAASMPMDNEPIRYESTVINGVEFVTKAQAEEIGRRSEQRTFKRLQNSPSTRRAAGIR